MARSKPRTEMKEGQPPDPLSPETAVAVIEAPSPPLALPVEQSVQAATPVPVQSSGTNGHNVNPATNGNGHPPSNNARGARQPDISWRLSSDRTTSIEVSAWVNEMTNQQTGELFEQVTFTIQRSYRDVNGVWARGGSWRNHDLPILLFLLQKAQAWALERRTSDSSCPL